MPASMVALLAQLATEILPTRAWAIPVLSGAVAGSNSLESPPALVLAETRSSSMKTVARSPAWHSDLKRHMDGLHIESYLLEEVFKISPLLLQQITRFAIAEEPVSESIFCLSLMYYQIPCEDWCVMVSLSWRSVALKSFKWMSNKYYQIGRSCWSHNLIGGCDLESQ